MHFGANSGTTITNTGHIGHLFMKECEAPEVQVQQVEGRETLNVTVTIATFRRYPEFNTVQALPRPSTILASIVIISSLAACILCGVYARRLVLLLHGIISNGLSSLVIGSVTISFNHPKPTAGAPKGDEMMKHDKGVVILLGVEESVSLVSGVEFGLEFAGGADRNVGLCSLLMITQFLAQLLLIPQGSLFGQIMFVASLAVSWMYNYW